MEYANGHPTPRLGEPAPRRVAVLRALQLGDLFCAVPALRALRAALPRAEIVLIGLPWAGWFADRFARYVDDFIEFPGYPGLPERPPAPRQLPAFLAAAQGRNFDLAIQMHGSGGVTNPLAVALGARHTAGYFTPGQYCPDPERFLPYPTGVPEVWRHLCLVEFLGVAARGEELEFPLRREDREELAAVEAGTDLIPGEYVCLHPGGRTRRRWPPEHFAAVGDALAAQGLRVVLTGSAGERDLTRAVSRTMRSPALDFAGRTSLGALGALLAGGCLLVCHDTGVSHLAAALRLPSIVVFHEESELVGWPPRDRQRHRVLAGLHGVAPAAVIAHAEDLLQGATGPAAEHVSLEREALNPKDVPPCVPCAS